MAVGLKTLPELKPIAGIRVASAAAGIAKPGRDDMALFELCAGSHCAAVFTKNAFCAAPVVIAKNHLSTTAPRYLLVNSGNANCGTGEEGLQAAVQSCEAVAQSTGCVPEAVLPFSTGVIGQSMPIEQICGTVPGMVQSLDQNGWTGAARAIMTTDTGPKGASRHVDSLAGAYSLTGISKGSGMIRPDMATMLAYVGTDATVEPSVLQHSLAAAVSCSFNRITVDGDTSTNDALVVVATGKSGTLIDSIEGDDYHEFTGALTEVCTELAQAIVRDGEGATKFISIVVEGARDDKEGEEVAYTIAHSPLVMTAFFASDPNWGRILACVGRAGLVDLDLERVEIYLDDVCIVRNGACDPGYTEEAGQDVMNREEITVRVGLGRGAHNVTVWTSDLSHEYVTINAEYRT